jgi:undecaprenyl diphosphate synthase
VWLRKNKITKDTKIPKHIAIIMDGNGRWAKKRLMPRSFGHKQGMERMIGLMERAFDLGVDYITVYALSTENLKRPKEELEGLYNLIRKHFTKYMERLCKNDIRLRVIGETSLLPDDVQGILRDSEEKTSQNSAMARVRPLVFSMLHNLKKHPLYSFHENKIWA